MNIVYLNEQFIPLEQAHLSVLDRGFLFADGIYDVISIYRGRLFRLTEHLERLEHNLSAIKLPINNTRLDWTILFSELLQKNAITSDTKEKALYLQITRGAAKIRKHAFPHPSIPPTVFAMIMDLDTPDEKTQQQGIHAVTHEDIRWKYCSIKSTALLPNILLSQDARKQGAKEVILIRDNWVVEGCRSNLFIVKHHTIITPPESDALLIGTSRNLILELAKKYALSYQERNISKTELLAADEVWATSATLDITPITKIDGHTIGTGQAGPIWNKMMRYYQQYKNSY